jgi:aminoglycoside phosphotransferase (APT) family kinase protein
VVVKLYADEAAATVAELRLRQAQDIIPTARLVGSDVAKGLVAQRVVLGRTMGREEAAAEAGEAVRLLSRLRGAEFVGLSRVGADEILAQADAPIELVAFALPHLAQRLADARHHLIDHRPAGDRLLPAHGDFNLGQLIVGREELVVIDLDTLCLAPAAFDFAAYATNVVSGRSDDLAHLRAVLTALVVSSDVVPEDLDWFVAATLLRRVDRAVRRMKRDWPERTVELVSTLEATLAAV